MDLHADTVLYCRDALQTRIDLADQVRLKGSMSCRPCHVESVQKALSKRVWRVVITENLLGLQAIVKIKAKHADENFTLSLPEYEEILDALVGSHYTNVPDHLSHESHHELGALLMQVSAA